MISKHCMSNFARYMYKKTSRCNLINQAQPYIDWLTRFLGHILPKPAQEIGCRYFTATGWMSMSLAGVTRDRAGHADKPQTWNSNASISRERHLRAR